MHVAYDKVSKRINSKWLQVKNLEQAHDFHKEIVRGLRTMFEEKKFDSVEWNNHRWSNALCYMAAYEKFKGK